MSVGLYMFVIGFNLEKLTSKQQSFGSTVPFLAFLQSIRSSPMQMITLNLSLSLIYHFHGRRKRNIKLSTHVGSANAFHRICKILDEQDLHVLKEKKSK